MDDVRESKGVIAAIYGCRDLDLLSIFACEKLEKKLNEVEKKLEESIANQISECDEK